MRLKKARETLDAETILFFFVTDAYTYTLKGQKTIYEESVCAREREREREREKIYMCVCYVIGKIQFDAR